MLLADPTRGLAMFFPAVLALLAFPQLSAHAAASTFANDELPSCMQSLTFRWTSGDPIAPDVKRPPQEALRNPPFLRDPDVESVVIGRSRIGPIITVRVARDAGAVIASETSAHKGAQMLVMLGDALLVAARVDAPLSDVLVLYDDEGEDRVKALADRLRSKSDGSCPGA